MSFWNRLRGLAGATGPSSAKSRLEAIDESTAHYYRFWLADAGDRLTATEVMGDPRRIPLTFEVIDDTDGRIRFDVIAKGHGRGPSVISVLFALGQAGVGVHGFEALDVIEDLDEPDLLRLIDTWARVANNGPTRSRMERLGGTRLLDLCLDPYVAAPKANSRFRAPIMDISFNTPGCEERLVRAAAEIAARPRARDEAGYDGYVLLDSAISRSGLSSYAGIDIVYPEDALLDLVDQPHLVGDMAVSMLGSLPTPLSTTATTTLLRLARKGDERAAMALQALRSAEPSPDLRVVVDEALGAGSNEVRASALWLLGHHWGADARPVWREFLMTRSSTLRDAAEEALVAHGGEEDLDEAASRLAKAIRAKPGITYSPPRGSDLIDFLVRYRNHPVARSALDDLSARWDRFPDPGLRDWLREHHSWIDPAQRSDRPVEAISEPEEPVEWPPPSIEREGDTFEVLFVEMSAWSDTRERFEALAEAHPSITILESDREAMTLRIAGEPDGLIERLWSQSGADADPGSS